MNWCTLAPLEYDRTLDVQFDLGNNVLLWARPDWLTQKEITYELGITIELCWKPAITFLCRNTMPVRSAIQILLGPRKDLDRSSIEQKKHLI
jgi:hypothetical protein